MIQRKENMGIYNGECASCRDLRRRIIRFQISSQTLDFSRHADGNGVERDVFCHY